MTAAAAISESGNGFAVSVPTAAGDGGPGTISMPGLPSGRLDGLKRDRGELRRQLLCLQEARSELEQPAAELQRLEAERQAIELETAEAVASWASAGCAGARPLSDPKRLADIAKRREAARGGLRGELRGDWRNREAADRIAPAARSA
jgi:hypothetical protein